MYDSAGEVKVHTEGDAGPYIDVDFERLEEVEAILKELAVTYVKSKSISLNGNPATKIINIAADKKMIEKINTRLAKRA